MQHEAICSCPIANYLGAETNTVPDGVILNSQTPHEVQVLQLRAALGKVLDCHIAHVGIDSQRHLFEPATLLRQVADGLVLQLPTAIRSTSSSALQWLARLRRDRLSTHSQ